MIYEARCSKCGRIHEYHSSVEDRNKTPKCCGRKTKKGIFTPSMVGAMSWTGHKGTLVNGKWMESGTDYKAYMKKNNLIPAEEGKQEATHQRATRKKKEVKELDATVERVVTQALG